MANFPCNTIPAQMFPWWIQDDYGGYSPCILGYPLYQQGCTLANCVGWAWGRYCEIKGEIDNDLPTGNAGTWYTTAQQRGMSVGQEPALGAVICFSGGHVAIVEYISDDGSYICCSESDYGGAAFTYRTRYKFNNYELAITGFQGFIYNTVSPTPGTGNFKWWMARLMLMRRKNGGYM